MERHQQILVPGPRGGNSWDAHINGDGRDLAVITAGNWGPDTQAAVLATTGNGDGVYDVEARYIGDDVAEVRIVFIDLEPWLT